MDLTDLENQVLDILAFDGEVCDTLAEFRRFWGETVPALMDGRFDNLCLQYMPLPHEQGVQALGQELTACGWGLYDFDGEDEYSLVLIPEESHGAFEAQCRREGHYFKQMKQHRRKWGDHAKERDPGQLMPCEEYVLSGEYDYFFNSLAGDFAAGEWKRNTDEEWQNGCVADLRRRPPQVTRAKSLSHLGGIRYSPETELYAAVSARGTTGKVLVNRNPANLNWFEPSPIGYDGPPQTLVWSENTLWVGDTCNITRIEMTERGTRKDVQNWELPKDGWMVAHPYCIVPDGLGRLYFSNEWCDGKIYKWENGQVTEHPFHLSGYDHLSDAVPVPGTRHIYMIHAVGGKGVTENLLELDMDTGRCRIAALPGMGEELRLRWFIGDWLLIQGNGEVLSDDFAQLINVATREVLRIRPGMFGLEKLQHIGVLTDGTVVLVTRRNGVGQVFRYPTNFWEFLRAASKPKKLEQWREYPSTYPDIPFVLPPQQSARKKPAVAVKKDHLELFGKRLTPPFLLQEVTEALGTARIDIHDGVRRDAATGEERPYVAIYYVWDELGVQGRVDDGETEIESFSLCLMPHPRNLPRTQFAGELRIGGKDYRDAKWEPFGSLAVKAVLGGFTLYTAWGSPENADPELRDMAVWFASRVEISYTPPKSRGKPRKYSLTKPDEPVLKFQNFNFKLAVIEVLMYEKGLLEPRFDVWKFAKEYARRKIDIEQEGYEPIPEVIRWFERLPISAHLAPEVTELDMDGGCAVYGQIWPFWDGEDEYFDLDAVTEEEVRQFPNLRRITLMSSRPEAVTPVLEACGVEVEPL